MLIVVVADNRAAEELVPVLQAFCVLTGTVDPNSAIFLPKHNVLPFQNPHPEIQEERALALWKIATGAVIFRGFADCCHGPASALG